MNNHNTIDSQQLLDRLNWRYATKKFDPSRKISTQDWATLEGALLLTPSSGGLQPWKFIAVTDPGPIWDSEQCASARITPNFLATRRLKISEPGRRFSQTTTQSPLNAP